ncbi:MAG TPA: hypothetical protein VK746_08050, partial [Candidatus Eisenbacteria bacterium]|nr:hypothetical protein [Candidatus Eisenbacteria bacterium]
MTRGHMTVRGKAWRTLVYFFKLFICGGPEMAPALPQSADTRSRLIADVVFDIPIDHAFSYVVPPGLVVARGQRVGAPLQGRARVGVVVGLREGDPAGLKPLQRAVEPVPVLSEAAL